MEILFSPALFNINHEGKYVSFAISLHHLAT